MFCSILISICVFILSINSLNFFTETKKYLNETNSIYCLKINKQVPKIIRVVDVFEKFSIPYLIVLCLDIKAILRLRESKRRVTNTNAQNSNRKFKFAVSTLLIDLIFLVFRLPETMFQAYDVTQSFITGNFSIYSKIFPILDAVSYSYSTAQIFIFFIFNKIFRKEFLIFFKFDCWFMRNLLTSSTNIRPSN